MFKFWKARTNRLLPRQRISKAKLINHEATNLINREATTLDKI
jgi:hypothetical protein